MFTILPPLRQIILDYLSYFFGCPVVLWSTKIQHKTHIFELKQHNLRSQIPTWSHEKGPKSRIKDFVNPLLIFWEWFSLFEVYHGWNLRTKNMTNGLELSVPPPHSARIWLELFTKFSFGAFFCNFFYVLVFVPFSFFSYLLVWNGFFWGTSFFSLLHLFFFCFLFLFT